MIAAKSKANDETPKRAVSRQFLDALLLSASTNPAALVELSAEQVQLFKVAVRRAGRRHIDTPQPTLPQLDLDLQPQKRRRVRRDEDHRWKHRNRATRRDCKYPAKMVEDARAMRKNGYFYKEIAAALEKEYGITVPWITVRDWVNYYYRVLG